MSHEGIRFVSKDEAAKVEARLKALGKTTPQ